MEDTTRHVHLEIDPRVVEFMQGIAGGVSSQFWIQIGCLGVAIAALYWVMFRSLGRFERTPTRTDVQLETIGVLQVRRRRSQILLFVGVMFALTAVFVTYETGFVKRWETHVLHSFPELPEDFGEDAEGYATDVQKWFLAFPVEPMVYLDRVLLLFVVASFVSTVVAAVLNRTDRLCWFRAVAYFRRENHRKNERSLAMANLAITQIAACDRTNQTESEWFDFVTHRLNPMSTEKQNASVTEKLARLETQNNGSVLSADRLRSRFGTSTLWSLFCLAIGVAGVIALWLALVVAETPLAAEHNNASTEKQATPISGNST